MAFILLSLYFGTTALFSQERKRCSKYGLKFVAPG